MVVHVFLNVLKFFQTLAFLEKDLEILRHIKKLRHVDSLIYLDCFLSPPVLMLGGLLCITFCLSVTGPKLT